MHIRPTCKTNPQQRTRFSAHPTHDTHMRRTRSERHPSLRIRGTHEANPQQRDRLSACCNRRCSASQSACSGQSPSASPVDRKSGPGTHYRDTSIKHDDQDQLHTQRGSPNGHAPVRIRRTRETNPHRNNTFSAHTTHGYGQQAPEIRPGSYTTHVHVEQAPETRLNAHTTHTYVRQAPKKLLRAQTTHTYATQAPETCSDAHTAHGYDQQARDTRFDAYMSHAYAKQSTERAAQ